jgi:hypothetical protein
MLLPPHLVLLTKFKVRLLKYNCLFKMVIRNSLVEFLIQGFEVYLKRTFNTFLSVTPKDLLAILWEFHSKM